MNPPVPPVSVPIPFAHIDRIERLVRVNGITYRDHGFYGCQLESIEWNRPPAFDPSFERLIAGRALRPFTVERAGLRWRITWCLTCVPRLPADQARSYILSFYRALWGANTDGV
jgi:hypothetical protein